MADDKPMSPAEKREQRLKLLEDHIGDALRQSDAELRAAPSWGKPLNLGDGYEQTPDEFKTPFKLLKDGGYVPPEVQLMKDIAALAAQLEGAPDDATSRAGRQRLSEMRQMLAMRLEKLRSTGSL